jgi:hypothetical protein
MSLLYFESLVGPFYQQVMNCYETSFLSVNVFVDYRVSCVCLDAIRSFTEHQCPEEQCAFDSHVTGLLTGSRVCSAG